MTYTQAQLDNQVPDDSPNQQTKPKGLADLLSFYKPSVEAEYQKEKYQQWCEQNQLKDKLSSEFEEAFIRYFGQCLWTEIQSIDIEDSLFFPDKLVYPSMQLFQSGGKNAVALAIPLVGDECAAWFYLFYSKFFDSPSSCSTPWTYSKGTEIQGKSPLNGLHLIQRLDPIFDTWKETLLKEMTKVLYGLMDE